MMKKVVMVNKQSVLPSAQAEIIGETRKQYILKLIDGPIVYRAKHNVRLQNGQSSRDKDGTDG